MKLKFQEHILSLPGLNGSSSAHWQSLWENNDPAFHRVEAQDWDHPKKDIWVSNLETAVGFSAKPCILLAHSLGCLQVAHWAAGTSLTIKGAFLVAPPNSERPDFPDVAVTFRGVPRRKFHFPSMLVASSNDPYCALDHAQELAKDWGSSFIHAGAKGHINALSQIGEWPQGFQWFEQFVRSLG